MTLQAGKDPMITHPLSSVSGMYVVTVDDHPEFVTADPVILFEQLDTLSFREASKVKVLLVSSECRDSDDITPFVWEAMAQHSYGAASFPSTWDAWVEVMGDRPRGFIEHGYYEFRPDDERKKRADAFAARQARFATPRRAQRFLQAAE